MLKPFDCHCHLDEIEDRDNIIKECKEKLSGLINCGTNKETNKFTLNIIKKYSFIYGAIGIHPIYFDQLSDEQFNDEIFFIEQNLNKKIVAIGETGLDFSVIKNKPNFKILKEKQEKYFINHINLAKQYDLPLIIHSRWAASKVLEILIREKAKNVVLHCFNASLQDVKKAIDNGYFISIATNILYNENIKKYIEKFDIDNFVLETDSPYLFKPINTPLNIWLVVKEISKIKNISEIDIIKITNKNIKKIFKINI